MSAQLFGRHPAWKSIPFEEPVPVEAGKSYYVHIDADGHPHMDEIPPDAITEDGVRGPGLVFPHDGKVTGVALFDNAAWAGPGVVYEEETL